MSERGKSGVTRQPLTRERMGIAPGLPLEEAPKPSSHYLAVHGAPVTGGG